MRARKRFGQHFLRDTTVVERIIAVLSPRDGDRLVEIGPGRGALTRPLLDRGLSLDAIELDRDLAAALQPLARESGGRLRVHQADALTFDFRSLAGSGPPLRLVGNLPYNVGTELLFRLLPALDRVGDMHFMLQREVVDRLAAPPGGRSRGRLGVMVQAWCEVERLFDVAPAAFDPPPAVQSGVVRLVPREQPLVDPALYASFAVIVRLAFAQRRKTLRNALRARLTGSAIEAAGIDPGMRAERLDVAGFARLAALAHAAGGACTEHGEPSE